MTEKVDIGLENVQRTLLLPLWGRAVETLKEQPLLIDQKAVEIINKINYDFSTIAGNVNAISQLGWVMRSLKIDEIVKQFLEKHPNATIVNIGCGFDTTFDRIDNGSVHWYDLDLPDVIELRRRFIPESDRRKLIASSFLDYGWLTQLHVEDNVLFIAAGVLYYFEEGQIKDFFNRIAGLFPESELVFDASSPLGIKMANKMVIKRSGMDEKSFLKWGLKSAKELQSWDKRISVLREFPFFKNFTKGLDINGKIGVFVSDALKMQFMVHLKFME